MRDEYEIFNNAFYDLKNIINFDVTLKPSTRKTVSETIVLKGKFLSNG